MNNCNSARITSDHLQSHQDRNLLLCTRVRIILLLPYIPPFLTNWSYCKPQITVILLNEKTKYLSSLEMCQTTVSIKSYSMPRYLTDHGKVIYIFLLGKANWVFQRCTENLFFNHQNIFVILLWSIHVFCISHGNSESYLKGRTTATSPLALFHSELPSVTAEIRNSYHSRG